MMIRRHGSIASAISEARASLKDPSRPFTPAGITRNRALFFEGEAAILSESSSSLRNSSSRLLSKTAKAREAAERDDESAASSSRRDDDDEEETTEGQGGSQGAQSSSTSRLVVSLRRLPELSGDKALALLDSELRPVLSEGAQIPVGERDELLRALCGALEGVTSLAARLCIARDALELLGTSMSGTFALVVTKSLFEASRTPEHDSEFFKRGVVGGLLKSLALCCKPLSERDNKISVEALVYLAGAIKNLSNDESQLRGLGQRGSICTLCDLCRACVVAVKKHDKDDNSNERRRRRRRSQMAQLLVQVTGCLRNMCTEKSQTRQLHAARAATALASVLRPFSEGNNWELALNVARGLAKLSLHEPMRAQLNADPKRLVDMLGTLAKAHAQLFADEEDEATYPAIIVRLGFVLGNLTAGNDRNRLLLGIEAGGVERLVPMLALSAKKWLHQTTTTAANSGVVQEHVVIKLIRLVANLSINPTVGVAVAHSEEISLLQPLLCRAADRDREELLLNVVSALTNLSYYRNNFANNDKDYFLEQHEEAICGNLTGVLLHSNHEAVTEAARAFGNFSRDAQVRLVMRRLRVDEALVLLLAHPSREVVFAAAGALVNVAGDPKTKDVLWRDGGHVELVSIARRAGVRDLELAALTAKALHNLLLDVDVGGAKARIGDKEADRLKDTLEELVDAAEAVKGQQSRDQESQDDADDFLAAARALLTILDESAA